MNKFVRDFIRLDKVIALACCSLVVSTVSTACFVIVSADDVGTSKVQELTPVTIDSLTLSKASPEIKVFEEKTVSVKEVDILADMSMVSVQIGAIIEEVEIVPQDVVLASYSVPNEEEDCKSYKKTWMDYTKVTNVKSNAYKLLNSEECYTCPVTGIRMIGDRYCIAVGSGYATEIGTKINLVMENGSVVKCILGDRKADCHTDETNRYQAFDGSVAEMIIDGTVFESTKQYPEELKGSIIEIQIIE